ncbi:hypothetical protein KJ605_02500 [Patescibacteria group bacterium]|nr:hypothetical protein [Patescibacteria group bacterium]
MIIPAILETTREAIRHKLQLLDGHAPLIQIDIADGILVDGKTVTDLSFLQDLQLTAQIQLHLMVQKPESFLLTLPNIVKDVCVQAEALMYNPLSLEGFDDVLQAKDVRTGLAFNFTTPFEDFENEIEQCDYIQFNTIIPGGQGRSFIIGSLDKIAGFKAKHPKTFLQVDGGVTASILDMIVETGVDGIVVGSAIFQSAVPVQAYKNFVLQFESAHRNLLNSKQHHGFAHEKRF